MDFYFHYSEYIGSKPSRLFSRQYTNYMALKLKYIEQGRTGGTRRDKNTFPESLNECFRCYIENITINVILGHIYVANISASRYTCQESKVVYLTHIHGQLPRNFHEFVHIAY